MSGHAGAIAGWLERFAAAVRARDYDQARNHFNDEVIGFGTWATRVDGLDELVEEQWKATWGATRGFRFDLQGMRCGAAGDQAWVAVTWHSEGRDANGAWYERPGRATFILERRDARWVAVHSHLSLEPQAPNEQP